MLASLVALGLAGCAGVSGPSTGPAAGAGGAVLPYRTYGAEQYFTLTWEAGERRGRPVVSGYVHNRYGHGAVDVRLLVESVDAAGATVATTIGNVHGFLPPVGRAYFEVPVNQRAATYRVSVLSWNWRAGPSASREPGPGAADGRAAGLGVPTGW